MEFSADNPYKDETSPFGKRTAERWEYNKKTYGVGGLSIGKGDSSKPPSFGRGQARGTETKAGSPEKSSPSKPPSFGRGQVGTENRKTETRRAPGGFTNRPKQAAKPSEVSKEAGAAPGKKGELIEGAKYRPSAKPAKKAEPTKTSKPAKKAKPVKKYEERSWADMTRTGRGSTSANKTPPPERGNGAKKPKRVSPGSEAIKAAQPKRENYRGSMVIKEPQRGYGRIRGLEGPSKRDRVG